MSRPTRRRTFRALPLATLTAIAIATMLMLSVGLAYIGVTWYSAYLEESINLK